MLKVLIVDDSLVIRAKMKSYFKSLGHSVVGEAKDGKEAILMNEKLSPDLITMDVSMPIMNGVEALKEIMQTHAAENTNIIMITANGQDGIVKDALKSGAKGYILKPISEEKLQDSIGKIFPKYCTEDNDFLDENDLNEMMN